MKSTPYFLFFFLFLSSNLTFSTKRKRLEPLPPSHGYKKKLNINPIDILAAAIKRNDLRTIKSTIYEHTLCQRSILLNLSDSHGRFPLENACAQGSRQTVALLLISGAHTNKYDNMGRTPLLSAAYRGSPNIMRLLLQFGTRINTPEHKPSPLVLATQRHNMHRKHFYNVIKILLEHGADPNQLDHSGRSAYMQAAATNQVELLNLMHKYNADPLRLSANNRSALEHASHCLHTHTAHEMEKIISKRELNSLKKGRKEQPIDLITQESLILCRLSDLIALGNIIWQKKTLIKHILYKIGTIKGPLDPFTHKPISKEIIIRLAAHFKIPIRELTENDPIHNQKSLASIAHSITRLENGLSIFSCPIRTRNLKQLKKKFRKRLKRFNPELAAEVHS